MISKKTLQQLNYFDIIADIMGQCVSDEGRHIIEKTLPITNDTFIARHKMLAAAFMEKLHTTTNIILNGWPAVAKTIHTLKVEGATVDESALYAVYQFCQSTINIKATTKNSNNDFKNAWLQCEENSTNLTPGDSSTHADILASEITKIPDISEVAVLLKNSFNADGTIRDTKEIALLKKKIASLTSKLQAILNSYTSDSTLSNALATRVPVLHNNMEVLAVKATSRHKIPGVITGASNSGATLFIIPSDALECINDKEQLRLDLDEERRKVIKDLCQKVTTHAKKLDDALIIMARLDAAQAVGKWGIQNNCVFASNNNKKEPCLSGTKNSRTFYRDQKFSLIDARHLLISNAVPITIDIEHGKNILIITGANAGGKTVALKTLALLCALNQAGFCIPVTQAALPIFDNIFIDIGDEQSISENLSTYTAHIKNLVYIVNHATKHSLCILDELGSGTDATEGAALSMALLDELRSRGTFVCCSTHLAPIKNYAYEHTECLNAAVEFTGDLNPTYKILPGVTGESHALDIAAKCGLSRLIVKRARAYVTHKNADVSRLIAGLTKKNHEADELLKKQKDLIAQLNIKEQKLQQREARLASDQDKLRTAQHDAESEWLSDMRRQLENLVRELRESEITREKTLKVKEFIAKSQAHEQATSKQQSNATNKNKKYPKKATLTTNNINAVDETNIDSKDKIDQLERLRQHFNGGDVTAKWDGDYTVEYSNHDEKPVFELRLLGLRRGEAVEKLLRQLDLCVVHGVQYFSIIHGLGDGVLQGAVHEVLEGYRACAPRIRWEYASAQDGGAGKTYVHLG